MIDISKLTYIEKVIQSLDKGILWGSQLSHVRPLPALQTYVTTHQLDEMRNVVWGEPCPRQITFLERRVYHLPTVLPRRRLIEPNLVRILQ